MKCTHVKLTYYKDSGKYYSEGELDLPYVDEEPVPFYAALASVRALLDIGSRPGLIDGYDFSTLVTVYTEFGPLTALFVREKDGSIRNA